MVTMCVANHYSMEIQFINVVCLFLILILHAEAQSVIVQDPEDTTVCEGDNATFTCGLFTPLNAAITGPGWLRNGTNLNIPVENREDNRTNANTPPVYISYTITVVGVTLSDDGAIAMYQCVARNFSEKATLSVVDVPSGVMNVRIRDDNTNESLVVLWDEVMDIFAITYNVTWYNDSGIIGMDTVNSPPYTVTGLTTNTSYSVTVVAINTCCGAGPVSVPVEAMTNMREPTSSPTHSPGGSSGDGDDVITVITIMTIAVMVICAI